MDSSIPDIVVAMVRLFGFVLSGVIVLIVLLIVGASVWARHYIKGAVETSFTRRVAAEEYQRAHELEEHRQILAKDLEAHRQAFALSANDLRARQERQLEEYAIYVARRHEATAEVYRALLAAVDRAEEVSPYGPRHQNEELTLVRIEEILSVAGASPLETSAVFDAWQEPDGGQGRQLLNQTLRDLGRRAGISARNDAYNAVYRNALYLDSDVEEGCRRVLEALHLFVSLRLVSEVPATEWLARRKALDAALEDAKCLMRASLSRVAVDDQPPASA